MRIIALDTETTGLEPGEGHRIIEIGCVEIVNRRLTGREFHRLLNPGREVDAQAFEVHGISDEQLRNEPGFAEVEEEFIDFVRDAELIVHNAAFDVGFIDMELSLTPSSLSQLDVVCEITDTWQMAKNRHPGQRNSIDSLCKRYDIDASAREKHGALLDAQLLAQVWLAMTGGQISLTLDEESVSRPAAQSASPSESGENRTLATRKPTSEELETHRKLLQKIDSLSPKGCLWLQLEPE